MKYPPFYFPLSLPLGFVHSDRSHRQQEPLYSPTPLPKRLAALLPSTPSIICFTDSGIFSGAESELRDARLGLV
ncbi:unnamed protein product [Dovyalis caffra]|uniref:Uncharacterized protein n=1 Tax=Dovyalis caffra TaxID=77055 RepID=A0AAV1R6M7_9ROSI|nr:unnamed protein product [Dovyalis caffra]CAK7323425.1 unnamed protein product [Dovyalis caffra]CAK7328672.1 unnamed protein product [Dovyalis caffra]